MAGSLPATAILPIHQFCLFGMICRLPADPLHQHALLVLTMAKQNDFSWFSRIRTLCLHNALPHPLIHSLPEFYKNEVNKSHKIKSYGILGNKVEERCCSTLPPYRTSSQARRHTIWWRAGANPYEVSKAVVQCRMLSGRYRTFLISRNWS